MPKVWFLLPVLLLFAMSAAGQWTLGPSASLLGWPPTSPGLGISGTYALNTRTSLTLDATWFIPKSHSSSGVYIVDPSQLPTGDTSSFSWKDSEHSSFATAFIGIQRTFNRQPRLHEWFWKIALGYGAGRDQLVSDYVGLYTGNAEHYELKLRYPYFLARLGGGSIWHLHHSDILAELADMGGVRWIKQSSQESYTDFGQTLVLAVSYRWRL